MKLTIEQLQQVLDTYDNGVLSSGSHRAEDGAYCALECVSLARNNGRDKFTDDPQKLGMPDIRPINDGPWSSDKERTRVMLPLISALSDWVHWTPTRKQKWMELVSIETVRQIISVLPLPVEIRQQCINASDLESAEYAAEYAESAARSAAKYARSSVKAARSSVKAARSAAEYIAIYAAWSAKYAAWSAESAEYAAWSAKYAAKYAKAAKAAKAATTILYTTVSIWITATEQSAE